MHQFALQTARWVPWARDYYLRKRKEGKQHHEAARALANIWVRILLCYVAEQKNPTMKTNS
ncbi:hypothetical protein [Natranaerobius thermophilus]|uniref:hypothetical protein n=1 Tax=Natranaerobius thermophilus TaxID=375929 RepID=UPI002F425A5D